MFSRILIRPNTKHRHYSPEHYSSFLECLPIRMSDLLSSTICLSPLGHLESSPSQLLEQGGDIFLSWSLRPGGDVSLLTTQTGRRRLFLSRILFLPICPGREIFLPPSLSSWDALPFRVACLLTTIVAPSMWLASSPPLYPFLHNLTITADFPASPINRQLVSYRLSS